MLSVTVFLIHRYRNLNNQPRYKSYVIPGETLIPGGRGGGKRFTLVLDMPHIYIIQGVQITPWEMDGHFIPINFYFRTPCRVDK